MLVEGGDAGIDRAELCDLCFLCVLSDVTGCAAMCPNVRVVVSVILENESCLLHGCVLGGTARQIMLDMRLARFLRG
jgi:hypothetical protein